jgi:hypothetical protein
MMQQAKTSTLQRRALREIGWRGKCMNVGKTVRSTVSDATRFANAGAAAHRTCNRVSFDADLG